MKRIVSFFVSLCLVLGFLLVSLVHAEVKPDLKIYGELEYEFSTSEAKDIEAGFQLDKFLILPKVTYGDYLKLSAHYYFRPKGNSYLNEFHATFIGLPLDSWLDFGLFERAIKDHHSRKTEAYSLYGNSFYRDDSYGVSWGNWKKKHKAPPFYWIVSLTEGYKVGHKQPAEQTSGYDGTSEDKMIQDDLNDSNNLFKPEGGVNLGINQKFGKAEVDVMGFYYSDGLNTAERSAFEVFISTNQKTKLKKDNDRFRTGIQINTNIGNYRFFGGFLAAEDAGLGRTAYVLEALHKFTFNGREIFKSITPVVSYSGYDIEGEPEYTKAESWDRTQIIIAGIIELFEKVNLKIEYVINDEKTGGTGANSSDIDNNEFLVQLEVKF